jgi:hypothetical protein
VERALVKRSWQIPVAVGVGALVVYACFSLIASRNEAPGNAAMTNEPAQVSRQSSEQVVQAATPAASSHASSRPIPEIPHETSRGSLCPKGCSSIDEEIAKARDIRAYAHSRLRSGETGSKYAFVVAAQNCNVVRMTVSGAGSEGSKSPDQVAMRSELMARCASYTTDELSPLEVTRSLSGVRQQDPIHDLYRTAFGNVALKRDAKMNLAENLMNSGQNDLVMVGLRFLAQCTENNTPNCEGKQSPKHVLIDGVATSLLACEVTGSCNQLSLGAMLHCVHDQRACSIKTMQEFARLEISSEEEAELVQRRLQELRNMLIRRQK